MVAWISYKRYATESDTATSWDDTTPKTCTSTASEATQVSAPELPEEKASEEPEELEVLAEYPHSEKSVCVFPMRKGISPRCRSPPRCLPLPCGG